MSIRCGLKPIIQDPAPGLAQTGLRSLPLPRAEELHFTYQTLLCAAYCVTIQRFVSSLSLQTLNQPDFDDRLPLNANTRRPTIS